MIESFQNILTTDPVHADTMNTKIVAPGNKLVDFVKRPYSGDIIGIEWDSSSLSPTLRRIDALGRHITSLPPNYFDNHVVWGGRRRCVRDRATGEMTFSANGRGDGLVLDGTAGDVLVQKPAFYAKFEAGHPYYRWWVSANPHPGFTVWPGFMQRGDPLNPTAADHLYDGAYEAYGYLDGGVFKLGSATGKKPVTGNSGTDSEHADWDPYPGLVNANVPDITLSKDGEFTLSIAEKCAGLAATGMGITNIWNFCGDQLLMYIEYGTFDIQTALGKGIVDLPTGEGFAGMLTGADNIDSRLAENGTGVGSGTNGQTPICWRGIENPYGNIWKFLIGANFDVGAYRLIKRDGTGTLAATLAAGSYEEGTGTPLTGGYVSALLEDELGGLAIMPSAAGGSDSTYLCDYWYTPTGSGRILLAGGAWSYARHAGPGDRTATSTVSISFRSNGARVEFRQPEEEV